MTEFEEKIREQVAAYEKELAEAEGHLIRPAGHLPLKGKARGWAAEGAGGDEMSQKYVARLFEKIGKKEG